MRQGDFGALGIQTWPFAAHWAHFIPEDFQLFTLRASGKVYKRYRVIFRSEEVDVVEVGLSLFRFSFIYQEMLGDRVLV